MAFQNVNVQGAGVWFVSKHLLTLADNPLDLCEKCTFAGSAVNYTRYFHLIFLS